MVKVTQPEQQDESYNIEKLKQDHDLCTLSVQTIYNWMMKLGFKFEPRKKSYYLDTHESPENIKYRIDFIQCYFQYKLCAYRWVSIPNHKAEKIKCDGEIDIELGFEYEKNDIDYMEFYVNDHIKFQ